MSPKRRSLLALAFGCALTACPGEAQRPHLPPGEKPEPPTPAPTPRADGRLPALAKPTAYALDLEIDPAQPRFGGTARIEVTILEKTSFVVLHGHGLEVTAVRGDQAARPANAARASSRLAQGGTSPEELVLAFERPLVPGPATITIAYSAPFDDELSGLYRLTDDGRRYAFTQFEPTDARRAYPCFDEPSFKVPFDVSITVPKPMIAVANAPEASREELAGKTRFRFARTQPLPTYLVALAVGELEVKEATRTTKPPIRLVSTKGKSAMSALALETTGALVDTLAEFFAVPYPYDKLDIVAVPDFRSGAMENPGLITFREERLLLDPARASVATRRSQALVIAHELAHQWFGDLVTAAWWNDLWLNEGMATWMERRVLDKWRPAWSARLDAVSAAHEAMDQDGLIAARAVRQPVVSGADADEAFDGITYEKGAAVVSTIERWIGEEAFQRGIRAYLKGNAFQSVHADRLLEELDRASGKDVTAMALGYLDKPGVPEVTARLECDPGGRWHMELSSQQWRPLGSKMPEEGDASWTIPVCVRAGPETKDEKTNCADLMAGAPSLVAGRGCPPFVHPNAGAGYFRFTLSEKDFVKLAEARKQLDGPARITVLSNAWAAVRSGQLEGKALLRVLPPFDDDATRHVVEQVVAILDGMSETLVEEEARPAFRKFAAARLAKRKKAVGWSPAPGKTDEDAALLRRSVLFAMADVVEDDATLHEADELATKWLADPTSVDADTGAIAIELASRKATDARLAALQAAMKSAKTREDRIVALRGMMGFDDKALLERALDVTLTDEVRANEMRYVFNTVFGRRKARPIAEAWVRARWDELRKKLPGALSRALVRAASAGCTTAELEERAAFYKPHLAKLDGAARGIEEALETVALCAALREKGAPGLRRALLGTKK